MAIYGKEHVTRLVLISHRPKVQACEIIGPEAVLETMSVVYQMSRLVLHMANKWQLLYATASHPGYCAAKM